MNTDREIAWSNCFAACYEKGLDILDRCNFGDMGTSSNTLPSGVERDLEPHLCRKDHCPEYFFNVGKLLA